MKILRSKWLTQFSTLAEGDPFLYNGNLLIKADPMKRNDMGDEKIIPCAVNLKNGHHWILWKTLWLSELMSILGTIERRRLT